MKKNVYYTLTELQYLNNLIVNNASIDNTVYSSATIQHIDNNFSLTINTNNSFGVYFNPITVDTNFGSYKIENAFLQSKTPGLKSTIDASYISKGTEAKYWRACIPLNGFDLSKKSFEFKGLEYIVNNNSNHPGLELFNGIELNVTNNHIDIFCIDDYLYIDNITENTKDFFIKNIGIIQACLAFFSGFLIGDECFIFSSDDNDFCSIKYIEHLVLIEHEKLAYTPFDDNPCPGKSPQISSNVFSELANLCNNDEHFFNCLFQFVKSLHYSLEFMPACLAIVIEGCKCIFKTNTNTPKVVNNPQLEGKIKKIFTFIINSFLKKSLDKDNKDARSIIIANLGKLFTPPNTDLLMQTFTDAGITLSEYEIQVIDDRNKFIHNTSFKNYKTSKFPLKNRKDEFIVLQFSAMTYIRLIYKLILTKIHFHGSFTNIIQTNSQYIGLTNNEPNLVNL